MKKQQGRFRQLPERMLRRLGPHYILWMMGVTRLSGSVGGLLVLYYVHLTLSLPENVRRHFESVSLIAVTAAVTLTAIYSLWETRRLRRVLKLVQRGSPVDPALGQEAGREAVTFAGRHHRAEAWLVPASTAAPLLIFLRVVDNASPTILLNVSMAAFICTVMALMTTYFLIASLMRPVTAYLLEHGVAINFDLLPVSRLRNRLSISFSLIILTTALMIGTLARQRARDMVDQPERQQEALASLQAHTTYITLAAVAIGLVFSTVLAQSVAVRVGRIVHSMKRVQAGDLSVRITPTGNDEIDVVTCQFNAMVDQLDLNDHTIRDLNSNLERKVKQRTRQLSKKRRELQASLDQLQQYDRLKTEFFSNVSHELRTPLTMILAPIEEIVAKRRQELGGDLPYMLDAALVNGRRLLDLINRLLEFSKLEAGQARLCLSPVDIGKMAGELVAADYRAADRSAAAGVGLVAILPLRRSRDLRDRGIESGGRAATNGSDRRAPRAGRRRYARNASTGCQRAQGSLRRADCMRRRGRHADGAARNAGRDSVRRDDARGRRL
jgi:signal transduction histidine kinase